MLLIPVLETIVSYTTHINPHLRSHLQPGYDAATVQRICSTPYHLPEEVYILYAWHNGMEEVADDPWEELFHYHTFLPLEAAATTYQAWQALGPDHYDPRLFPLFTFMGEYYAIYCSEEPTIHGPIAFVYQGVGQVYDSLTHMLQAIAACYTAGAYYLQNGRYIANASQVATIKAIWNRCRTNTDGTVFSHHP